MWYYNLYDRDQELQSTAAFYLPLCGLKPMGEEGRERFMNEYTLNELYRLAQQGNTEALTRLGKCYKEGDGVEVNPEAAAECFTAAAEGGNPEGQYQLGLCYEEGFGVSYSRGTARKWFNEAALGFYEAASRGNPQAQCGLGNCCLEGRPVPPFSGP